MLTNVAFTKLQRQSSESNEVHASTSSQRSCKDQLRTPSNFNFSDQLPRCLRNNLQPPSETSFGDIKAAAINSEQDSEATQKLSFEEKEPKLLESFLTNNEPVWTLSDDESGYQSRRQTIISQTPCQNYLVKKHELLVQDQFKLWE